MHDPCSVAFEIKYPWRSNKTRFSPKGTRSSFITIWHHDPETDGTDDSCDWFGGRKHVPKNIQKAINEAKNWFTQDHCRPVVLAFEAKRKYSPEYESLTILPLGEAYGICCMILSRIAWSANREAFGPELVSLAHSLIFNEVDTLASCESPERFIECLGAAYARYKRPWYKKPRWHVHHWRIQVHPWQKIRRWLFDRCSKCGGRYTYGYCPASDWSGKRTWHLSCDRPTQGIVASVLDHELCISREKGEGER